jgi:hypothetical protein
MDINIVVFDPHYFIFNLGISLNRYEQWNDTHEWVKKELDFGFLLFSIRFSIIRDKQKRED